MASKKLRKKLRMHTHAQYVELRNNEDRLIGERFTALLIASSFLAVVWATADEFGLHGRLAVASLGLVVTLLIWWMNYRGAEAATEWRQFAIEEEKRLYGHHKCYCHLSKGPYGLRMIEDQERKRSFVRRFIRGFLYLFGWLNGLGLGATNIVIGWWVPLVLALWWGFAICYSYTHDWDVVHPHTEVKESVESESDGSTP